MRPMTAPTTTPTVTTETPQAAQARPDQAWYQLVPFGELRSSPLNPRTHFDPAKLEELAGSMRGVGIIEPLVVRRRNGQYEIVAGERRFRAAKLASLAEVPVVVRELTDGQVLEIQVVENNQRDDLNALEEAEGFDRLLKMGYPIERLAERLGRSVKYIYDRRKLLDLVPAAKKLLLEERFTAGHAILLARLKPEDQKRVMARDDGGLFEPEHTLWNPNDDAADENSYKTRSVRELQAYIDQHVRFDAAAPATPQLFPETHEALTTAAAAAQASGEKAEKIISITHAHYVEPDAKEGKTERIYGPRSWKRADGSHRGAKACDRSVLGVVAIGPERGAAFRVCTDKDCRVHWQAERKAAQGDGADARRYAAAQKRQQASDRKWGLQRAREDAADKQWTRVAPAVLKACGEKLKAATLGLVAETAARAVESQHLRAARELVGKGTGADGALRLLAAAVLREEATGYGASGTFPRYAKRLGVDVGKILAADRKAHPVVQTSAKA